MRESPRVFGLILCLLIASACATDLGTGSAVVETLIASHPITVGRLIEAHMDTSQRLRVYLQICEDATSEGIVCSDDGRRVLAMVKSHRKSLLQRIAERYLKDGRERPVYVYGPICDGLEEMILVPRCQIAVAMGIWDPYLQDYVIYSTLHGSGGLTESEGFNALMEVTSRAAGLARKAAR